MAQLDVVVIIPAFNEENSINLVLNDLPQSRVSRVIVVNNGSTDQTAAVAKAAGAEVLYEPRKGYGQACLTGLARAYELNPDVIAFVDGDYSDYPGEITLLLDKISAGFDFVIGSRNLGKAEPGALLPQAKFGNWLSTTLMSLLFRGYKFSDLGPFRAIKTDKLKKLQMQDTNFGWTMEMQVKAIIHKLKCTEVSVSYRKRVGVSKITGTIKGTFSAGYKILYTLFKYRLLTIINGKSPKAAKAIQINPRINP